MFYLELFTQLCHHLVIKIGPINSDDLDWNPISANDLFLDEASNDLLGYVLVRSSFNPFGEVVDSNKNKFVSICGSIRPIMSMPHIAKGQGDVRTFKGVGGT